MGHVCWPEFQEFQKRWGSYEYMERSANFNDEVSEGGAEFRRRKNALYDEVLIQRIIIISLTKQFVRQDNVTLTT